MSPFNEKNGEKTNNQKVSCLICNESVAVLKEYNLHHYYEMKHQSTYSKFSGKLHFEKFEFIKHRLKSQMYLFMKMFAENESVNHTTSYKIVLKMAVQGKAFTDGNFIKEYMIERKPTCL